MLNASERAARVSVPAPRDGVWTDALNGDSETAAGGILSAEIAPSWARILVSR
jgi:hypothetical protein